MVLLQELCRLTTLTALTLTDWPLRRDHAPASHLARLSSLTALQSLDLKAFVTEAPLPASALSCLVRLTSLQLALDIDVAFGHPEDNEELRQLSGQHLGTLTALRYLSISHMGLSLSREQATAAWQEMEQLDLCNVSPCLEVGFAEALPALPQLTRLGMGGWPDEIAEQLSDCSKLVCLDSVQYNALGWLPRLDNAALTRLDIGDNECLERVPVVPSLSELSLSGCCGFLEWPLGLSSMRHLTLLDLGGCQLHALPAPLAALPAIQVLHLRHNELSGLPEQLGCIGSLRDLHLVLNPLVGVPEVLASGAASRLQRVPLSVDHLLTLAGGHPGVADRRHNAALGPVAVTNNLGRSGFVGKVTSRCFSQSQPGTDRTEAMAQPQRAML